MCAESMHEASVISRISQVKLVEFCGFLQKTFAPDRN